MIYSDNPCVPVRKRCAAIHFIFMRQDYYVRVGFGGLLYPAYVVCRGSEPDGLVIVHLVFYDNDTVVFLA